MMSFTKTKLPLSIPKQELKEKLDYLIEEYSISDSKKPSLSIIFSENVTTNGCCLFSDSNKEPSYHLENIIGSSILRLDNKSLKINAFAGFKVKAWVVVQQSNTLDLIFKINILNSKLF